MIFGFLTKRLEINMCVFCDLHQKAKIKGPDEKRPEKKVGWGSDLVYAVI